MSITVELTVDQARLAARTLRTAAEQLSDLPMQVPGRGRDCAAYCEAADVIDTALGLADKTGPDASGQR